MISALKRRRRSVQSSMIISQGQLEKWAAELAAIDCRLTLLKPNYDPTQNAPPRRRKRSGPKTLGAIQRQIVRLLRQASAPMTVREMLAALSLPTPGKTNPAQRLRSHLVYLENAGRVVRIGHGRQSLWICKK